ncbi:MAG TPA: nucleotidyltransferase domain-containing protein [Anaerolineales bacterium]|nr:nucleotidyltransferase domain-containing protein [Anaerolineales bacterium]
MNQHLSGPIRPILENYVHSISEDLPNLSAGFYIVGSIAWDEFNERFSDIDFVAVLNHRASTTEIEPLDAAVSVGWQSP